MLIFFMKRLLFDGALLEGRSSRSLTERTFRTKSFRVGKLIELGHEREPDIIPGIVTEVKDNHIVIDINWFSNLVIDEIARRSLRRSRGEFYLKQRSHANLGRSVKPSYVTPYFIRVIVCNTFLLDNQQSKKLPEQRRQLDKIRR